MQLTVVDHPLARARLSRMRDERTDNAAFRAALRELTQMLVYEATRDLAIAEEPIRTPVIPTTGYRLAAPPLIVPVLRAGLGMADTAHGMLPESQMGFVGLARNEETFQPEAYMASLPSRWSTARCSSSTRCWRPAARWCTAAGCSPRAATSITVLCALAAPRASSGWKRRTAAAGVHRQRRRGSTTRPTSCRGWVTRATVSSARSDHALRRARHRLLGAEVHAAALAGHPSAELVGVWGRDLAKAKAVGAEFDVPGFADVDELLSQVDAVAIALRRTSRRRWPSARPRPQGICCWRSRSRWTWPRRTGWSRRSALPASRRSCSSPSGSRRRPRPG